MQLIKPSVLIVDDEFFVRKSLSTILRKNYNTITAARGDEGIGIIKNQSIDLVLLDLKLPDTDGLTLLKQIKDMDENTMVIIITAVKETSLAVKAMKLGAYDYITKPINVEELRALVDKALEKRALIRENKFLKSEVIKDNSNIIGQSKAVQELNKLINAAAKTDCPVLITGESGTGKELITRAINDRSARAGKPFVVLNCAAIPDNLLESELFGYERGSFTGAMERKEGKFELANGGTIFLDEIGSMSLHLQAKLLRVLQDNKDGLKDIERLGGSVSIPVDVRILAATNVNMKKAIGENKFREDLYYRLNVFPINIPPLRERKEDIPLLADYFFRNYCKKLNKKSSLSVKALSMLVDYNWPGNIRELKNLIERLVTINDDDEIAPEDLPLEILVNRETVPNTQASNEINLKEAIEQMEQRFIKKALRKTNGNQIQAAKILGIHRNTLLAKVKQLNLQKEEDQ